MSSRTRSRFGGKGEFGLTDVLFIALAVAFFALLLAYTVGCERLYRGARG